MILVLFVIHDGCTSVHVETCARLVFSTQLINASRE
jgi:hypothetical protein